MGLKEQIQGDMKKAAKERNSLALSALRTTLAAIKNKESEARGEIGEDLVRNVLATMVKQRRESIDLYHRGGRTDLAEKEAAEIAVLEAYLPMALSGAGVETLVGEAGGAQTGLVDPRKARGRKYGTERPRPRCFPRPFFPRGGSKFPGPLPVPS